jgi:hypothetical protein
VEQSFYNYCFAFGWSKVFTIIVLLLGGAKFLQLLFCFWVEQSFTIILVLLLKIKSNDINDIKRLEL